MSAVTTRDRADRAGIDQAALARRAPATADLLELANWLHNHGAGHLSPIERLELAERLITRRRFLIGAGALVLAGCGAPSASAPTATPAATRLVKHAFGETEVPVVPQRVVALHDSYLLDALVALEVAPVGAAIWWAENAEWPWLPHLRGETELDSTRPIGTSDAPNLEQIATLDPDLILGMEFEGHGEIYDQLSQIAPTVIIADSYPQITPALLQIGAAVGREPRAEALVAEYEQAAAEIRQAIAARADIGAVSVFRFVEEGFQTQAPDRWVGQVLADAGVPRPASQRRESQTVSLERVDLIDGDVLIVFDATTDDPAETRARIMDNPIFSQLKAVQNDTVYVVGSHWNSSGFLWARLLQADLRTIFVEGREPAYSTEPTD